MAFRWMFALRLVAWAGAISASAIPARAASEPDEFVIQEVCINAAGQAVPGDPVTCASRRKLRLGEAIPYRRLDAGGWQALYSYPVRGPAGERRAMAVKVFGGNDTSGFFGDLGHRAGFDLLDVGPDYISGIRTSDSGGGDQIFWRTTSCERTNGWIFFPPGLQPGQHGETRSTLKITKGPSVACPWLFHIAPDFTTWDRPVEPTAYTSGKRLDTVLSLHFAYGDPADPSHTNDSMEKFYFTREYGFTRWEAWQTRSGCEARVGAAEARERCRPSPQTICNGPNTADFFGKTYLRLDCRDSTFVVPAEPPFNPLVNAAAPGDIADRSLVTNGTFFDGAAEWQATGPGVRLEPAHGAGNNSLLRIACSPCSGQGIAQDFDLPATDGPGLLRWGISLAGQREGGGKGATGTLALTISRDGRDPQRIEHSVSAGASWKSFGFEAPWPGGGAKARLEFTPEGDASLGVDDAFAVLLTGEAALVKP